MMKHQNNFIKEDVLISPEKSKSLILPNHEIISIRVLYRLTLQMSTLWTNLSDRMTLSYWFHS